MTAETHIYLFSNTNRTNRTNNTAHKDSSDSLDSWSEQTGLVVIVFSRCTELVNQHPDLSWIVVVVILARGELYEALVETRVPLDPTEQLVLCGARITHRRKHQPCKFRLAVSSYLKGICHHCLLIREINTLY